MSSPIWIGEKDVRHVTLARAIALLEKALVREARGAAINMEKTHVAWDAGTMHAIGAVFTDSGLLGVKSWAHTPKGATPLEILWDAESGKLLAVIEAFAMGQLRTAGMAGVATSYLAREDAQALAVCGTGKQALAQVAAVAAVRRLKDVRVYGRDAARRDAFVARVRRELGLDAAGFADPVAALADAGIVTLVTRAREPFVSADMVEKGAHVNAMGAITPERREFAPDLLPRAALVAVDSIGQARALATELAALWPGSEPGPEVVRLCDHVAAGRRRPADADITIFKSLGVGVADLALAEEIYRVARATGAGTPLPEPAPAPLSFADRTEPSHV